MKIGSAIAPILRGALKGASLGTATPIIELIGNAIHKKKQSKNLPGTSVVPAPHDIRSIAMQIIAAAYVLFGTEAGKTFLKSVLLSFGIDLG